MSKREASQIAAAGVDIDAPRAKRRKEATATANSSASKEQIAATDSAETVKKETEGLAPAREDRETIKEKGLQLWQTVKDAVNKEGRALSHDFMRLPSKRQYPDYYQQIKRPIALDEIKAQLDAGAYASFEDVKQDFDTCFRNAKRYNMRESQIWKDAKHLHKLISREYVKMTGISDDAAADGADEGDEHAAGHAQAGVSDDEGGGKKKKAPNMTRLLKSRLQKLVEKTDDSGRVLSTEFMELPNKKQWPIYYKTIKRPQCLENIFKRLKRKEYHTSQDFANDVELVFSNALEFNQDNTPISNDAVMLREYFRQLMSDLPAPYSIPTYSSEHHTKIKLKVPAPSGHQSAQSTAATVSFHPLNPSPSLGTLRIPPQHSPPMNGSVTQSSPDNSKSAATFQTPTATPIPVTTYHAQTLAPAPLLKIAPAPVPIQPKPVAPTSTPVTGTLQPATFPQQPYQSKYYPNAVYQTSIVPPTVAPAPLTSTSTVVAGSIAAATAAAVPVPIPSTSQLPATTDTTKHRQLQSVMLTTKPLGRRLELDHTDGVKVYAIRLMGETGVRVSNVKFLPALEEDEESSEDEKRAEEEEEEEEEEQPKKRSRGRPRKKPKPEPVKLPEPAKMKSKGKAPVKAPRPHGEVQLRLNGAVVKGLNDANDEWEVELPIGPSILELGEKGGVPWRVYLDRILPL